MQKKQERGDPEIPPFLFMIAAGLSPSPGLSVIGAVSVTAQAGWNEAVGICIGTRGANWPRAGLFELLDVELPVAVAGG